MTIRSPTESLRKKSLTGLNCDVDCIEKLEESERPLCGIKEKLKYMPKLLVYILPLILVFLFEYIINSGLVIIIIDIICHCHTLVFVAHIPCIITTSHVSHFQISTSNYSTFAHAFCPSARIRTRTHIRASNQLFMKIVTNKFINAFFSNFLIFSSFLFFHFSSLKLYIFRAFGWTTNRNTAGSKWCIRWAYLYHDHRAM